MTCLPLHEADEFAGAVMALAKSRGFRAPSKGRRSCWAVRRFPWRKERIVLFDEAARTYRLQYEVFLPYDRAACPLATINVGYHLLGKKLQVPALPILAGRYIRKTLAAVEDSLVWFDHFSTPGRCLSYLEAGLAHFHVGSSDFDDATRFLERVNGDQGRVEMPSDRREIEQTDGSLLFRQMMKGEFGNCFFPGIKGERQKLGILTGRRLPFRKVRALGIRREKGFEYWVTAAGRIVRSSESAPAKTEPQLVMDLEQPLEPGVVYFLDVDGDLSRST